MLGTSLAASMRARDVTAMARTRPEAICGTDTDGAAINRSSRPPIRSGNAFSR